MKVRFDFVTNSSSSSFVISKSAVTEEQKQKIFDYVNHAKEVMPDDYLDNGWEIEEGEYILGRTNMDNFDMRKYLELIGVPQEAVRFSW